MKKKYWADVSVGFDFYTEEIEAESKEEAESIAYDIAKSLVEPHNPKLRVRTVGVIGCDEVKEEKK